MRAGVCAYKIESREEQMDERDFSDHFETSQPFKTNPSSCQKKKSAL